MRFRDGSVLITYKPDLLYGKGESFSLGWLLWEIHSHLLAEALTPNLSAQDTTASLTLASTSPR